MSSSYGSFLLKKTMFGKDDSWLFNLYAETKYISLLDQRQTAQSAQAGVSLVSLSASPLSLENECSPMAAHAAPISAVG